jgi:hypothetical protein
MLFCLGVLTGLAWMFLNTHFLMRLIKMGFENTQGSSAQQKKRILVLSVVKFPVLYLTGFFILKTRFFPIGGILTGLTLSLIALVVWWFSTVRKGAFVFSNR